MKTSVSIVFLLLALTCSARALFLDKLLNAKPTGAQAQGDDAYVKSKSLDVVVGPLGVLLGFNEAGASGSDPKSTVGGSKPDKCGNPTSPPVTTPPPTPTGGSNPDDCGNPTSPPVTKPPPTSAPCNR